ncbi:hypothetical protein SAMN04488577_1971 [Bacillus sp. cl95]|uniref:YphA family membrane protein n=1 Tax=Bacillus sp. UNCCL13 TaxID=1502772 RepID=UPI0008E0CEA9|nr:hypothetical protein [Bacillus sp. UNCCL13]SFA98350.1 hypothetical protein SAMN02799634_103342 [Bacillus sp. UNCCL13]SFQ80982.1 hypothetical protein SAMN04488577_1971 [Bacillus sp. cl95]
MEGILFYWISWSIWISATFILSKKNSIRTRLAVHILILIILSNYHVQLGNFQFYASGLYILLVAYASLRKERKRVILYLSVCSIIVAASYSSFHLYELFDPVWLFMKREWMLGILLCYLSILMQKKLKFRMIIVMTGAMQGDILNALLLSRHSLPYPIGGLSFLDVCATACSLIFLWSALEHSSKFFEQYLPFQEKGNQKSS